MPKRAKFFWTTWNSFMLFWLRLAKFDRNHFGVDMSRQWAFDYRYDVDGRLSSSLKCTRMRCHWCVLCIVYDQYSCLLKLCSQCTQVIPISIGWELKHLLGNNDEFGIPYQEKNQLIIVRDIWVREDKCAFERLSCQEWI